MKDVTFFADNYEEL